MCSRSVVAAEAEAVPVVFHCFSVSLAACMFKHSCGVKQTQLVLYPTASVNVIPRCTLGHLCACVREVRHFRGHKHKKSTYLSGGVLSKGENLSLMFS